jgi:hypothetical protein
MTTSAIVVATKPTPSGPPHPPPVHHHARLGERERTEGAHRKQGDQPIRDAAEDDEENRRQGRQDHDADRMDETAAAGHERMRQKIIVGNHAAESREPGKARVRRQRQNREHARNGDVVERTPADDCPQQL